MKRKRLLWMLLSVLLIVGAIAPVWSQDVRVRVDRWLEIRDIQGAVAYVRGTSVQPAKAGMRLLNVGDGVNTGAKSSAKLAVDTGIGFVSVAENTNIRVQELRKLPNGGQVTRLQVAKGQARLQVRRFTNPDSRLEIQTPAGLSAVRGTEFGVSVQPDGKTGVATLEGSVAAIAQGQVEPIKAGFQSLVVPGEAPLPATRLREDTRLQLQLIETVGGGNVRITGKVDFVNLVLVSDQPISLERNGQFDITTPLPPNRRVQAVVITPLGKRQVYELAVP